MNGARLLLLLFIGLAIGSAWLAWLQPEPDSIPLADKAGTLPDYYLTDVTLTHYGPDGALEGVLKSKRMTHLPGQGTALQQPHLTRRNPTGAPWVVTADSGQVAPDGDTLDLAGNVVISRLATPDNRAMQLETPKLRYRQSEAYAETDEAVTVTSEKDRIDAVGLKAWLKSPGHLQFLSQVRARYEP